MSEMDSHRPIGLLISGGLDSCILAGHLLSPGRAVRPIYVRSGLSWESAEYAAAGRFLAAIDSPQLGSLVTLDLPLGDLYGSHWSITGCGVPAADTPDEAVYLPGRNALLIVKAALWCHLNDVDELALAVLGSNPFADATAEFFDEFTSALNRAVGGRLKLRRPLAGYDKREVMLLGRELPLELTFSCIAPVDGRHCGCCNKCAERAAAFDLIEAEDPTSYAAGRPSLVSP